MSTYDIPEKEKHNRITLYPNPVNERLNIVSEEMIVGILLYNSLGINTLKLDQKSMNFEIDMSQMAKGIYFIRLDLENETVIKKIIH